MNLWKVFWKQILTVPTACSTGKTQEKERAMDMPLVLWEDGVKFSGNPKVESPSP